MNLSSLPPDDHLYFIQETAEALAASEDEQCKHSDKNNTTQLSTFQEQVATASPIMISASTVLFFGVFSLIHSLSATCKIRIADHEVVDSMRNDTSSMFTRKSVEPLCSMCIKCFLFRFRGKTIQIGVYLQPWLRLCATSWFSENNMPRGKTRTSLAMFRSLSGFAVGPFSFLLSMSNNLLFSL